MYLAYNYGFIFSWRPQQVSDLAKYSLGGGTPSTKRKEYWKGTIPWFQSSSLTDNCFDDVTTEKRITEEAINNSAAKLVSGGSIAVVTRVGVGKLAYLKEDYTTSQDFLSLCELKHDKYYSLLLLDKTLNSQLAKQGTSIAGITKDELLNRKIILSENKNEQEKIGKFFEVLNGLIAKNQRKLELLEKLKKGYQQKIFSQELRFEGFKDSWEEQKLSDVAEVIGGGTPSSANSKYWNGDINWFTPNEIGDTVYVNESKRKITNLGIQRSSAKLLPTGTILMSSRAGIGTMAILSGQACTNQGFQSLIPQKANSYFLYSLQPVISKIANRFASGSTFTEISGRQVANLRLNLPKEQEQKKIGLFFKALDSLTAGEVKKLGDIQTKKRAYLQKLFI